MKLISELTDKEVIGEDVSGGEKITLVRRAVRVVARRNDGQIALIKIDSRGHHMLPGGAIEVGEDLESALKREIMEEVGAKISNVKEIGLIIEYRTKEIPGENESYIQISYGYSADIEVIGSPKLQQDEIDDGEELMWAVPEEAVRLMKSDKPTDYKGHFNLKRDLAILAELGYK